MSLRVIMPGNVQPVTLSRHGILSHSTMLSQVRLIASHAIQKERQLTTTLDSVRIATLLKIGLPSALTIGDLQIVIIAILVKLQQIIIQGSVQHAIRPQPGKERCLIIQASPIALPAMRIMHRQVTLVDSARDVIRHQPGRGRYSTIPDSLIA